MNADIWIELTLQPENLRKTGNTGQTHPER